MGLNCPKNDQSVGILQSIFKKAKNIDTVSCKSKQSPMINQCTVAL